MRTPIYLDYLATTPCDHRVVEAMLPYFTRWFGNASSTQHAYGWQASEAVAQAREQVADLIGAQTEEIIFTSGATESINLALKGVLERYRPKGTHIIINRAEHRAVLDCCAYLEQQGASFTFVPVDGAGNLQMEELEASIRSDTILICQMMANNETGVLFPMTQIGNIARRHELLFFSDATQAVGKIPVDLRRLPVDLMAFSSHKIYGPKGVGALYIRSRDPRVSLDAQVHGGGQEKGLRSGTLNVSGIVGFGEAARLCSLEMELDAQRLSRLRDRLERALLEIPETFCNGGQAPRLPAVSNLSFGYLENQSLLTALTPELAISAGSACSAGSRQPSHVLMAMGLGAGMARNALRFSLGRMTQEEEIDRALEAVSRTLNNVRRTSQLWNMRPDSAGQADPEWAHPGRS